MRRDADAGNAPLTGYVWAIPQGRVGDGTGPDVFCIGDPGGAVRGDIQGRIRFWRRICRDSVAGTDSGAGRGNRGDAAAADADGCQRAAALLEAVGCAVGQGFGHRRNARGADRGAAVWVDQPGCVPGTDRAGGTGVCRVSDRARAWLDQTGETADVGQGGAVLWGHRGADQFYQPCRRAARRDLPAVETNRQADLSGDHCDHILGDQCGEILSLSRFWASSPRRPCWQICI